MVKDNEEDTELQQEEYQYSDPDSSPAETYVDEPEQQAPTHIRGMVDDKRKRIIVILVVVGLIFVVLQFVKAKNKTNSVAEPVPVSNIEKAAQEKPLSAQPVVAPAAMSTTEQPAPSIPNAAAVVGSNIAGVPPADSSKLNDDQSSKTIEPVQTQPLQTSVSNLETNVTHLTEVVNSLQAQVQDLLKKHEHLNVTSSVQKKIKHSYTEKRKNREPGYKMGMRTKPKVYYIKAVVPRRAWLQTESGEALTVKVDDRVPGYGIIKSIDASEGVVTTSSNKIIRFSANDN